MINGHAFVNISPHRVILTLQLKRFKGDLLLVHCSKKIVLTL